MNGFNDFCGRCLVVLIFSPKVICYITEEGQQLEPLAMVKKPIPFIANQEEEEEHPLPMRHRIIGDPSGASDYRDNYNGPLKIGDYEDSDWTLPPPPPPPPLALSTNNYEHFPMESLPNYPTEIVSRHRPISSFDRRDDFTLFLVVFTIAGFFGLIISMFIPFILIMQSQGSYGSGGGYGSLGGIQPAIIPAGLGGGSILGPTTLMGGRRRRSLSKVLEIMESLHKSFYDRRNEMKTNVRQINLMSSANNPKLFFKVSKLYTKS